MNIYRKLKRDPITFRMRTIVFKKIVDVFHGLNITLSVNETNCIVSLITDNELKISKGLKLMQGFGNKRKFEANTTHVGDKSVDLATIKSIYTSGTVKHIAELFQWCTKHNISSCTN